MSVAGMGSRSLESIVQEFERRISTTDSKLDHLAWRVDTYELTSIPTVADEPTIVTSNNGVTDETSEEEVILLRELLSDLDHLKQSYASLRSELQQVHSMQADLTQALREKVVQVQDVFINLRTRFTKHCKDAVVNECNG